MGKVHFFPKFTTVNDGCFVQLTITLLNIMYYKFVCSLHCMQDNNTYHDAKLSHYFGLVDGPSVDMVLDNLLKFFYLPLVTITLQSQKYWNLKMTI
jgi:hypothetical protein